MPSLSSVLAGATLAAGGLASVIPLHVGIPIQVDGITEKRDASRSVTVNQVRNTNYVRHGPLALAKAYRKFGIAVPDDLLAAVAKILDLGKRDTGSATASPAQYDVEYLTPVSLGTPAQKLNLNFDTGSSDLWVFSSETPKNSVHGQTVYDPSKSNSSQKLDGASWSISYGDGSTSSGDVYTDVVSVGDLTVKKQAVESAKKVSDSFTSDADNDGLLGLGFSSINTVTPTPQKTFFDNALSSLDAPVFTADLKHNAPGTYSFGVIDKSLFNGTVSYSPVDSSDGFWKFTSPGFAVGDGKIGSNPVTGIADTGTTLLLLDQDIVDQYYKQVSGAKYDQSQGGYTFSCDADLPAFSFGVGKDASIKIPGSFINFSPLEDGSPTCFGGIQSSEGVGFSIFGDIALKAAYVVFDAGEKKLGWASKKLD